MKTQKLYLVASKEAGLEVHTEKTACVLMSYEQNRAKLQYQHS
jgi:hypothetical protein